MLNVFGYQWKLTLLNFILFRKYKAASESHDSCGTFALYKGQIESEVCQADVCGIVEPDGRINATRFDWTFNRGYLSDRSRFRAFLIGL